MDSIDKRNRLDEEPFSYRVSKDGKVFISYFGKHITTFQGKEAEKLLSRIEGVEGIKDAQLVMAKATGNFKRGNER